MTTVIIALWRYRLNLRGFNKPSHVRIIVVGPANCVVDETWFVFLVLNKIFVGSDVLREDDLTLKDGSVEIIMRTCRVRM